MSHIFKKLTAVLVSAVLAATLCAAPAAAAEVENNTDLHIICTSNVFGTADMSITQLDEAFDGNSYVTVQYLVRAENQYLINASLNANSHISYDKNVLALADEYNSVTIGRNTLPSVFRTVIEQNCGAGMPNLMFAGNVYGNFASMQPPIYAYNDTEPVVVIQLRFRVLDRTAGETKIDCNLDALCFCDTNVSEPYAQNRAVVSGKVNSDVMNGIETSTQIHPMAAGDLNYDGKINARDRIELTRYIAKWSGYEFIDTYSAASIDGSEGISAKDRIALTRYIAKWNGYETLHKV